MRDDLSLGEQLLWLVILAIPIATIARTIVYEEVFREPREYCMRKSRTCRTLMARKFFYLFTCEYCFSHWVTLLVVIVSGFWMLMPDWRGYIVAYFSLVFVANVYLNLYARLRVDITQEKKQTEAIDKEIELRERQIQQMDREENGT